MTTLTLTQVPAVELGDMTIVEVVELGRVTARMRRDVTQLRDTLFGLTYGQIATAADASPLFDSVDATATEVVSAGVSAVGRAEIERLTVQRFELAQPVFFSGTRQERRTASAMYDASWRGRSRFNRAHRIAARFWGEHGTYADWVA